jgi:hypothetical protein
VSFAQVMTSAEITHWSPSGPTRSAAMGPRPSPAYRQPVMTCAVRVGARSRSGAKSDCTEAAMNTTQRIHAASVANPTGWIAAASGISAAPSTASTSAGPSRPWVMISYSSAQAPAATATSAAVHQPPAASSASTAGSRRTAVTMRTTRFRFFSFTWEAVPR